MGLTNALHNACTADHGFKLSFFPPKGTVVHLKHAVYIGLH